MCFMVTDQFHFLLVYLSILSAAFPVFFKTLEYSNYIYTYITYDKVTLDFDYYANLSIL